MGLDRNRRAGGSARGRSSQVRGAGGGGGLEKPVGAAAGWGRETQGGWHNQKGAARELRQGGSNYRCCLPALAGFARPQSAFPDGTDTMGSFLRNSTTASGILATSRLPHGAFQRSLKALNRCNSAPMFQKWDCFGDVSTRCSPSTPTFTIPSSAAPQVVAAFDWVPFEGGWCF